MRVPWWVQLVLSTAKGPVAGGADWVGFGIPATGSLHEKFIGAHAVWALALSHLVCLAWGHMNNPTLYCPCLHVIRFAFLKS